MQKNHRQNSGFSLLEILIAILIFVIGSASIWSLFALAIDTHAQAVDEQMVALLAESLIAELQDVHIQKGKVLLPIKQAERETFPGYRYDIQFDDLPNDAVFITLTISYSRRGQIQEEIFHTVIHRVLPGF